jgi:hypothetical protein
MEFISVYSVEVYTLIHAIKALHVRFCYLWKSTLYLAK